MEKIFKLKENGTNVRTELVAGLTTFMMMAYIIALNPNLLGCLDLILCYCYVLSFCYLSGI